MTGMSFSYLCVEPLLTGLDENSRFLQGSPGPCWVQPLLPTGACPAPRRWQGVVVRPFPVRHGSSPCSRTRIHLWSWPFSLSDISPGSHENPAADPR